MSTLTGISFFAPGTPKGQPRPRAFARRMGNKFVARVYEAGTAEAWKSEVALAARPYLPESPLTGPLCVSLVFIMPRPKAHYRTGKNAGELREDAPTYQIGKPDCDNLAKAVMDALTTIGMWHDDGQVVSLKVTKSYRDKPGCWITVDPADDEKSGQLTIAGMANECEGMCGV